MKPALQRRRRYCSRSWSTATRVASDSQYRRQNDRCACQGLSGSKSLLLLVLLLLLLLLLLLSPPPIAAAFSAALATAAALAFPFGVQACVAANAACFQPRYAFKAATWSEEKPSASSDLARRTYLPKKQQRRRNRTTQYPSHVSRYYMSKEIELLVN